MENTTMLWSILTQISIVISGLAAGGLVTVETINWLKNNLKLPNGKPITGGWTLVLLGLWATLLTVATSIVSEQLAPGLITSNTWGTMLLGIIVQASIRYRQLKDDLGG